MNRVKVLEVCFAVALKSLDSKVSSYRSTFDSTVWSECSLSLQNRHLFSLNVSTQKFLGFALVVVLGSIDHVKGRLCHISVGIAKSA